MKDYLFSGLNRLIRPGYGRYMVTRMLPTADINGPERMLAPPGDAGRVLDLGRIREDTLVRSSSASSLGTAGEISRSARSSLRGDRFCPAGS